MYVCMCVYMYVCMNVCTYMCSMYKCTVSMYVACVCMFIFMYTDSLKIHLYLTENAVFVD